jgi:hypothetical protein
VIDGVRWQEVFLGADGQLAAACGFRAGPWTNARALMPNLRRMMETDGVVIGAPSHGTPDGRSPASPEPGRNLGPGISASGPNYISLPGYMEIFSGHPDPSCDSNDCPRPSEPTIADSEGNDAAVVTSWPTIARAASSGEPSFLVSAGRRLLGNDRVLSSDVEARRILEGAADASPLPGEGDYRPDAQTAHLALRVLAEARPRFLFVGLGDTDEHAHRGYYRGYLEALHAADAFLGELREVLRTMGPRGEHTTVLVTTDHGRARDFTDHGAEFPESARVWLVAAGKDVRGRGPLRTSRRYTLSNVAPTVRALLGTGSHVGVEELEPALPIIGGESR